MTEIMFSKDELEVLLDILKNEISDLRMEIADTDQHGYREMLKNREVLIRSIEAKLQKSSS